MNAIWLPLVIAVVIPLAVMLGMVGMQLLQERLLGSDARSGTSMADVMSDSAPKPR